MSNFSRWIPLLGGAVAGAVVALVIASGNTSTHTVTTTVVRPEQAALPASFNKGTGETVNQIYRGASPGVVDIIVTSQQNSGLGFFAHRWDDPGRGRGRRLQQDRRHPHR